MQTRRKNGSLPIYRRLRRRFGLFMVRVIPDLKSRDFLAFGISMFGTSFVHEEARQAKAGAASLVPKDEPESIRTIKVRIGPDGRIVVPAPFREALGIKEGDTLVASLEDGEIRLLTIPAAVRRAQALVRQFVPQGVSLVDELLSERHREAEGENRDG